jgi:cysteine desulfuration protein SufE
MSLAQDMTMDELLEEFEQLPDWGDRCDFLIDLGMELPKLDAADRTDANRVHGCQSNVWMVAGIRETDGRSIMEIRAESDSMFVSGLIAILLMVYDGKTPEEILEVDAEDMFRRLELHRHLSPQRRNGLAGMVERVRLLAAQALRRAE